VQKNPDKTIATGHRLAWDDVRYFLVLSQAGSLSQAARALGVEHSTVARRVDALERTLGLRLFDRLPRGWILTPEGDTLAAQAARLDDEAQAFARAALGASVIQGSVRISAPPVLASHLLVPRLARRRPDWAHVQLEIVGESREANLARGEADLAVRMSRPTAPGLVVRQLGQMHYGLYATPDWLKRPESEWPFIGYDDSLSEVPQQRWLDQIANGRPFIFRSNDLAAILQATRAGLGLAALPRFLAIHAPELVEIPGAGGSAHRNIWLVMHPDVKRSPRVRLIADLVVEVIAAALAPTSRDV